MRPPLAPLLVVLAAASFVSAQDRAECENGLDKLNNKSGESPCTVGERLRQACTGHPSSQTECECNTVMYNIMAACAACQADATPNWADWADDQDCGSNPGQFPANVDIGSGMIPQWAYLPLTEGKDFNLSAAILEAAGAVPSDASGAPGPSRANVATQIAVPIAAGIGVALIATLSFWFYWRHKWRRHRDPRMKTLPLLPQSESPFWRPWRWFYALWPAARSRRLQPSKKDSDWAIDEDTQWLGHARGPSAASAYNDPFVQVQSPTGGAPLELDDLPHTSAHIKETSSSSLLPHIGLREVRVPTFMERLVSFRNGLRKSASYAKKHVSPVSPDAGFRIDDSAEPTPAKRDFVLSQPKPPSALGAIAGSAAGSSRTRVRDAVVERSDFEPEPEPERGEGGGSGVLLISRDGEDFALEDYATTAASHSHANSPRTPTTFRQDSLGAPSAYSGTRSGTRTNTGSRSGTRSGTGSSWLPSPNRANTASTISGAYPSELRHNPELASPRTWATRFPAPPQAFPQSPTAFRSPAAGQSGAGSPPAYDAPTS